jgi:hypothetical protein
MINSSLYLLITVSSIISHSAGLLNCSDLIKEYSLSKKTYLPYLESLISELFAKISKINLFSALFVKVLKINTV